MDTPVSAPAYSLRRPVKTALHQAILDCRIHQVRLLVEKHGGDVDAQDMYGRTPLMLACLLENEEYGYRMARMFMLNGCYINMTDNMDRTALHYACIKGREKIISKFLHEDNLDISMKDDDGNNALMLAAISGHPKIVSLLIDFVIKFGLSIDERNAMGYTAFLLACKHGNYISAYYLLVKGCSQADIRDLQHDLTPKEWIKKNYKEEAFLHRSFTTRRSKTMPEMPPGGSHTFQRETTMYREQEEPVVHRHIGTAPSPGRRPHHQSIGSALKLPDLFKTIKVSDENEPAVISGKNACDILLRAIDDSIRNRKKFRRPQNSLSGSRYRSTTSQSRATSTISRATLSSSKLRAFIANDSKKGNVFSPDIITLFKMYSDKYVGVPQSHMTTSRESLPHVRFDTDIESPVKIPDLSLGDSSSAGNDITAAM